MKELSFLEGGYLTCWAYVILKIVIKVSFKSNTMWLVGEKREEKEGRQNQFISGPYNLTFLPV